MGREAAQTTVTSLVRDYYATPETWDTTVALDRIIGVQNTWLAGINRRRQPIVGLTTLTTLTTLTALVLRGQSYTLAQVGDSRAYLLRGGNTLQLTHDHVVNHPAFRHQLLRSVGAHDVQERAMLAPAIPSSTPMASRSLKLLTKKKPNKHGDGDQHYLDQRGVFSADVLRQQAQRKAHQRPGDNRHRQHQALLRRAQAEGFGNEGRHGAVEHPDAAGKRKIQKRREQGRGVPRLEELFKKFTAWTS